MEFNLPCGGDIKIVKRFALFPIKAGHRIKWLETCYIQKSYSSRDQWWNNNWFVDKDEYESFKRRKRDSNENNLARPHYWSK